MLFEHTDLCMSVTQAGGSIYYVADAMIWHLIPPPFEPCDYPYFLLRWSDDRNRASVDHFARKWQLDPDDPVPAQTLIWATHHRERALSGLSWPLGKLAGFLRYHGAPYLGDALASTIETAVVTKPLERRRLALSGNPA